MVPLKEGGALLSQDFVVFLEPRAVAYSLDSAELLINCLFTQKLNIFVLREFAPGFL